MPIGYDFICENQDCPSYQCRLSLAGPWPLVKIEDLLKLDAVFTNPETLNGLKSRQEEGRVYACAIFPNTENLEYHGTRVQMFCPKDMIVWDEDFIGHDWQQKLPTEEKECSRCHGPLITADMAAGAAGLPCPYCRYPMTPNMWFTKSS